MSPVVLLDSFYPYYFTLLFYFFQPILTAQSILLDRGLILDLWESHTKETSSPFFGNDLHLCSMEVCNVLYKGQAQSDATIEALVSRILHLLEAIPNLAQMVWCNPNPIIRYLENSTSWTSLQADGNLGLGKFHRIAQ